MDKEENKVKNKPSKERWFEMDWTSPENINGEELENSTNDGSSSHENL